MIECRMRLKRDKLATVGKELRRRIDMAGDMSMPRPTATYRAVSGIVASAPARRRLTRRHGRSGSWPYMAARGVTHDLQPLPAILRMVVPVSGSLDERNLHLLKAAAYRRLCVSVAPSFVFKFCCERIVRHGINRISEADWLELAIWLIIPESGGLIHRNRHCLHAPAQRQFGVLVAPSLKFKFHRLRIVRHSASDIVRFELALGFGQANRERLS